MEYLMGNDHICNSSVKILDFVLYHMYTYVIPYEYEYGTYYILYEYSTYHISSAYMHKTCMTT